MSEVKVEIRLITKDGHPGDWLWMGKMSQSQVKILCDIAGVLSDATEVEDE